MKKLLFLGPPFDLKKGGAEYQCKLLENILGNKYEVFYLFRNREKLFNEKYITYDYLIRNNYNPNLPTDSLKIYQLIRRLSPDIVYVRGIKYTAAVGVYYAKKYKKKIFLHLSSSVNCEKKKISLEKKIFFNLLEKWIKIFVVKNASIIIGQAKYQDNLLRKNYKRKCDIIIPNLCPEPILRREKYNFTKRVVWVGNFKKLKQPEIFIDLAKQFRLRKNVLFVLIGRPDFSKWGKEIFQKIDGCKNIKYLGELSIDEVNQEFSKAYILVNTSKYEGFPNTYIQAWMHEVPVVALNSDPDELIKKEKIGFHSKSIDQLYYDVKNLLDDKKLHAEMAKNAHFFSKNHFSMLNASKFLNLFDRT